MYKYERIRDLREDQDLTQEEMAKIIGCKDQTHCFYFDTLTQN